MDGTGGLYRLRKGHPDLDAVRAALWVSKPRGQSYESFYASLGPRFEEGVTTVWGRQMVLGPTPEFCLHAGRNYRIREEYGVLVTLEPVWSGFSGGATRAGGT